MLQKKRKVTTILKLKKTEYIYIDFMKKLYLPLLAFSIISCNENNNIKTVSLNASTEMQTKQETDSVKWIDSFREFRNSVYQKDKEKVKRFIDFPIMNENNEIW